MANVPLLGVKIEGQQRLQNLAQNIVPALDTRMVLDAGAAVLFNRMRTRFLQEMDPQGVKWVPSMAAQRRARLGKGGGTLFDTGKLFRSLQLSGGGEEPRMIGTSATSKTGFPYPAMHQYGLGGAVMRQFLGFGDEDLQLMSAVIMKRIVQAIK